MIKASFFSRATDAVPELRTFATFADLVKELNTFRIVGPTQEDKKRAPMVCPAEFSPGAKSRKAANVVANWFAMLDFDGSDHEGMTSEQMRLVLEQARGLASFLYTTHGHSQSYENGLWKFRLGLELTRGVLPSEWQKFIRALRAKFLWLSDEKCEDIGRCYFTPSVADEHALSHAVFEIAEGSALDVDLLLGGPLESDAFPGPSPSANLKRLGEADLDFLATKLAKSKKSETARKVAKAVRNVLDGKPYAEKGDRDNMQFQVAGFVFSFWPDADPESVKQLFRKAIEDSVKEDPEAPSFDGFCEKVDRQCKAAQEEQAKRKKEEEDGRADMIRQATGGRRSNPYADQELDDFAKDAGVSRKAFRKRWILEHETGCYLFQEGQYTSKYVQREQLWAASERVLSLAWTAGVELRTINSEGNPKRLSAEDMLERYGMHIRGVVGDFCAARNYYDMKAERLVLAMAPLRVHLAERSEAVELWLRKMAGQYEEKLLDWVACVTRLDEPTAALYIQGPPGVGKSLFAEGLSRLWSDTGYTAMEDIAGTFNESICRCPLVFADEKAPPMPDVTAWLRVQIQNRVQKVRKKYRDVDEVHGSLRFVLAANNDALLHTTGQLTPDDIEALGERLIHLKLSTSGREAIQFLRAEAPNELAKFVRGDAIAKHALWLRDTRAISRGGRFLCEGDGKSSGLEGAIVTSNAIAAAVIEWCLGYLAHRQVVDQDKRLLARVHGGELLVNVRGLIKHWQEYIKTGKSYSAHQLSNALISVSKKERKRMPAGDGQPMDYSVVRRDILEEWGLKKGYATEEQIEDSLSVQTQVGPVAVPARPEPREREPGEDDMLEAAPF